ncbi:MAG: YraN family protein [Clostridia bacterium]|nr:YraN family protein [Clostridia bacterium]MBR4260544.1 YraN family protein [Clostridia bacterium]
MEKKAIGKFGEDVACKYLIKNDYEIIDRNFSCRQGEIDIIAYDLKNKEIVFFEVKTRTSFNYGFPSEAVNNIKQKHILNSVKYYLYCKGLQDCFVRIDVIEIVIDTNRTRYKLNHLKGVI